MSIFFRILIYIGVAYAFILVLARFFADFIIFPAPACSYSKSENVIFLENSDGTKIAATYLPKKGAKYCVIYSHGNGEDLGMIYPVLQEYAQRGVSLFSYDYPGYGQSEDKKGIRHLEMSADTAWEYVTKNLGFAPENVVLVGYSLGSAAACRLALAHPEARALVIVGGFSTGAHAVMPVNIIPWDILNNVDKLKAIKIPTLFLHGTKDFIVPPRNARMNFDKTAAPKRIVWFEGGGHLDLTQNREYWREIFNFIESPTNEKSSCRTVQ